MTSFTCTSSTTANPYPHSNNLYIYIFVCVCFTKYVLNRPWSGHVRLETGFSVGPSTCPRWKPQSESQATNKPPQVQSRHDIDDNISATTKVREALKGGAGVVWGLLHSSLQKRKEEWAGLRNAISWCALRLGGARHPGPALSNSSQFPRKCTLIFY